MKRFVYLNTLEKLSKRKDMKRLETKYQKMSIAIRFTKNVNNKKSISKCAKLRHYNTLVKPECMYAAESLVLSR